MRKTIKVLLLVVVFCCFAACTVAENIEVPESKMELVVREGGFTRHIVDSSDTVTFGFKRNTDGSACVILYDHESLQKLYLTNQLSATFDDQNPGWIPDAAGGICPIYKDGSLFLLKAGIVDISGKEGTSSYICKMNPDASGKELINLKRNQTMDLTSGVAYDGRELYFLRWDFDEVSGVIDKVVLCKTDFDKHKIVELTEFEVSDGTRYTITGVYKNGLVFTKMQLRDDFSLESDEMGQFNIEQLEYSVDLFDIKQQVLIPMDIRWFPSECSSVITNDCFYQLFISGLLEETNLVTGETRTRQLNPDLVGCESVVLTGEVYDGKLAVILSDEGQYYDGGYDLQSEELIRVSLSYKDSDGATFRPAILSETTDAFFVMCGAEYVETMDVLPDGSHYSYEARIEHMGLIEKSDYWNSLPNYRVFSDEVR